MSTRRSALAAGGEGVSGLADVEARIGEPEDGAADLVWAGVEASGKMSFSSARERGASERGGVVGESNLGEEMMAVVDDEGSFGDVDGPGPRLTPTSSASEDWPSYSAKSGTTDGLLAGLVAEAAMIFAFRAIAAGSDRATGGLVIFCRLRENDTCDDTVFTPKSSSSSSS